MEIVCKGGVQPHKKVHLRGELPEGKLSFAEKSLDFGSVGVGVTLTRSATIKNISARDCNFRVSDRELPHGVKVLCRALWFRSESMHALVREGRD